MKQKKERVREKEREGGLEFGRERNEMERSERKDEKEKSEKKKKKKRSAKEVTNEKSEVK